MLGTEHVGEIKKSKYPIGWTQRHLPEPASDKLAAQQILSLDLTVGSSLVPSLSV